MNIVSTLNVKQRIALLEFLMDYNLNIQEGRDGVRLNMDVLPYETVDCILIYCRMLAGVNGR